MATLKTGLTANLALQADTLYDDTERSGAGPIEFDSSQLIQLEAKRAEIVDYIRLRLADGIVDVELDPEHYNLAIDQALIKYRQRASNSQEESYAFLELLPETQEYILPREIMAVRKIFRRGIGSATGNTATQFEPFAAGYLNTYMLVAGRVGGLASYELYSQYQELAMRMFGGYMNYTFNPATKKLTVVRKLPSGAGSETVMLWVYNYKPNVMLLNDHMIFPWIQDYAYSFAKRIVGEAREKFASIAGPQGGTALNGSALKSEAQAEMDALEQQLKDYVDGSMPLTWVIG
jgi:hypothetical protein